MNDLAPSKRSPVLEYARHLRALHALDLQGKHISEEADAIRDQMDAPWDAMTSEEQERMRWLSEDLYVLTEGGPPSVTMTDQEIHTWKKELDERKSRYQAGDIDGWLAFLRKPRPSNFPPPDGIPLSVIRFFQAQCWEKFDDHETAAFFRTAAENLVMEQLTRVA